VIGAESRYQTAERLFATGHQYDQYGRVVLDGDTPSVPTRRTSTHEVSYRLTTLPLPDPGPLIVVAKQDETLQSLAWKTLRSTSSWWMLAEVNPQVWYPLDLAVGAQLHVPV
jgi:hypothetical protein